MEGLLALMDFLGVTNVAERMRYFCAYPHKALHYSLQVVAGKTGKPKSPAFRTGAVSR